MRQLTVTATGENIKATRVKDVIKDCNVSYYYTQDLAIYKISDLGEVVQLNPAFVSILESTILQRRLKSLLKQNHL